MIERNAFTINIFITEPNDRLNKQLNQKTETCIPSFDSYLTR